MYRWLLVAIFGPFLFLNPTVSESETNFSCETLTFFYLLWEDSTFGRNPDGVERAAWIIGDRNGYQKFQKWPNTGQRSKMFLKGSVPRNALAVVHTHPAHKDSKPSSVDISFGKRIRIDVYVISADGLWMSNADGKISRVLKYVDFKDAVKDCKLEKSSSDLGALGVKEDLNEKALGRICFF